LVEHRGAGFVADETRSRISPHLRGATSRESGGVRIETAADSLAAVTRHAIALDVTRDARVQISFGFERVMSGLTRRIAPNRFRRMESPRITCARRTAHRNADAHVATETEALLVVAARALRRFLARVDRVHRNVVVRMDAARARATVVTANAEIFFVAVRAKFRVGAGHHFMALDPIGTVLRIVEPTRRLQHATREKCANSA
jgi:hypothetical protein